MLRPPDRTREPLRDDRPDAVADNCILRTRAFERLPTDPFSPLPAFFPPVAPRPFPVAGGASFVAGAAEFGAGIGAAAGER